MLYYKSYFHDLGANISICMILRKKYMKNNSGSWIRARKKTLNRVKNVFFTLFNHIKTHQNSFKCIKKGRSHHPSTRKIVGVMLRELQDTVKEKKSAQSEDMKRTSY